MAVSGKIKLFPRFSEYQIHLVDMQPDGTNAVGNDQLFTLDDITGRLEEITADFSGSQQIQVRGEITRFKSPPDQPWYLSDASDKAPTGRDQKIHCFFNSDLINNTVLEDKGSAVRIQGAIRIWGAFSTYQIYVEQIKSDVDGIVQCQCFGCESCQGQTDMCPPLQDPEYELCVKCYHESPDREDRVVHAVYMYFNALGGNGFSTQKERQIQMGSDNRVADVVLVDENGSFAAIAECKGAGYVGHGIEQLNSYLSATDTHFGIFANRADPEQWEFYENRGQNQFEPITCDQFKAGIRELTDRDLQSAHSQIQTLESENEQLKRIQRDLKDQFDRVKVFLESAMQTVNQASGEIDE